MTDCKRGSIVTDCIVPHTSEIIRATASNVVMKQWGNDTEALKTASKCPQKDIMKRICSSAKPITTRDDKEFYSSHGDVLSLWCSVRLWVHNDASRVVSRRNIVIQVVANRSRMRAYTLLRLWLAGNS